MAFDKIDTIQETGNSVMSGLCMICCCCIASIVCTSMGIHYLNVGETEYIQNEKDIDDIEDRMVQYPVPATTSNFVEEDTEIVYYGEIRNIPGTPLVDNTFSSVTSDSVRYVRTAQVWGVIQTVTTSTASTTVSCKNSNDKTSSKTLDTMITYTYTYSVGWTSTPATCRNPVPPTSANANCVARTYSVSSTTSCSSLSSQPTECHVTGNSDRDHWSTECGTWANLAKFSSPCATTIGTACGGTTTIGNYKMGDFYVEDHYLLNKYFGMSPTTVNNAYLVNITTVDGQFKTCDSSDKCSSGMCSHMFATSQPSSEGDICSRAENNSGFLYGDQQVYWTDYPAKEKLYTCTKQDYRTSSPNWWLEQASTESSGGGLDNLMEIDYDILSRSALTKDICIQTYRDENDENLSTMRWICGFLLVFSCVFVFCSFACCFDIMTDMLTLVPQLLAEAVCCGLDYLSDGIQAIEDCADCMVYCLCMCIGSCVGLFWFGFIFAIIWVSANAGFGGLFAICFIFLCCFVALGFSFARVTQKKKDELDANKANGTGSGDVEAGTEMATEQQEMPQQQYQPAPQPVQQQYPPQEQQPAQQQGGMMGMMNGFMNQAQQQMNQMQGNNQGQYQQGQQSWGAAPTYAPNNQDLNNDGIPDHLQNNLPPGFECRKDFASGRFYWVNHANQQSQWHDPRGAAPAY